MAAYSSRRERLIHAVHHLEHILPDQAPLQDFVHHNTLHGYQHLPFPDALVAAYKVTGILGYLSPESFRALLAQERITMSDLEAVLQATPWLNAEESLGPCRRLDVYRTALLQDLDPIPPSRLAWELERVTEHGLWQGCLDVLHLPHDPNHIEEILHLSEERAQALLDRLPGEKADGTSRSAAELHRESEHLLHLLIDQVGVTLTVRGLLMALTGQDILVEVRPYLVRQLAAFLDQGLSPWPLPGREKGFYAAWRQVALADPNYRLEELPDWYETIEQLPEEAVDAVEQLLSQLGLPEKRWEGYLKRLALELPGWSGMVQWRRNRPGYLGFTSPTTVDYLAVRLVLEQLTAVRLCRAHWRLGPRLDLLSWHFRRARAELVMRWYLFNDEIPEYLASRVQMFLRRAKENPVSNEEWQRLAHLYLTWRLSQGEQGKFSVCRHAWPLFLLTRSLGLTEDKLRQGGYPLAKVLLDTLSRLTPERVGYLWLQAYERPYREAILAGVAANHGRGRWAFRKECPVAQVVFCMDDREEGFRRHLEERNPSVETLGAAGFFGVPMNWQGLDDAGFTALCPVVVTPVNIVREQPQGNAADLSRRHSHRRGLRLRWRDRFLRLSHRGVVTPALLSLLMASWALIGLVGRLMAPLGMGRLLSALRVRFDLTVPSTLNFIAPAEDRTPSPEQPREGFTDTEQATRVEGMLRTMGLTYGFAPLVVIMGHGSSSQNNPHLSAYDCGACSGRHGGPNARLFAAMANRPIVRDILATRGITIPDTTWFLGTERDTGSEEITWYDLDQLPTGLREGLAVLRHDLDATRALSAHERCRRLASAPRHPTPIQALAHVAGRTVDFSQARPELGHVTNAVALIGRRSVTQGVFFDRRMFLISYDPTQDPEGKIVEGILLAAGPVGAGISLEYYFSTVNNDRFGCGTKVVHNVTGFFGVMEGTSSDLRTGLPRQMVEIHEAMRLLVIVEQKPGVLTAICQRQRIVAELVLNAWIQLAALDPENGDIAVFNPEMGRWESWQGSNTPLPRAESSPAWYGGCDGPLAPALIRQPEERTHG
ncbi:conserved hypothetical protein [Gammaproteobacteria bacterium]